MMFMEQAAYVSDIMSFYLDNQISETFTTEEMNNMIEVLDFDWNTFENEEPLDLEKEDKFEHKINFKVSEDTFNRWMELRERMKQINGYDNESKVFEFAIIETLNIPIESIT